MRAPGFLLVLTLMAAAAAAQTPPASLTGVVVDPTGGVLPAARVQLSQTGRVVQLVTTDANGAFTIPAPPGQYNLLVMLDGFKPQASSVTVTRAMKPMRITLPLAAVQQEITVAGAAPEVSLAATRNADEVAVTQNMLALLPIFDDDAVRTLSRFLDVGSVGGGGATILVNGMEVNGLNVGTAAIEQIKINADPYSAVFSRPGRGRIDIITKPGSEAYHGDVNAVFRDAALNARNAFAVVKPPEQRRIGDGFLGGPVGNGRNTSFMLSVKDDTEAREAVVFALQPQGTLRQNVAQPYRHVLASFGITHQGARSTISIRPAYEEEHDEYRGVGGTTLGTAGTTYYHRQFELTYNQQTILRPTIVNQFQILGGHEYEPMTSVSELPGIVVSGAFTGGGAQIDVQRTEVHVQFSENLAITRGTHFFQVGAQAPDWSQRGFTDQSDFGGTYYFSSLAAYAAGQPYSYTQQFGDGRINWLEKVLGLYANDDWQLGSRASVSLGLRYDWSNYFPDHDNLAPRLSLALKPWGSNSTIVRGGAGVFYDKIGPFPIVDVREFQPGGLQRIVLNNPAYPNPFVDGVSPMSIPSGTAQFAPNIQVPWTLQYSAGVEHQLTTGTTLSVTYYGSDGRLLRSRDINAPRPPLYATRPNPALGVVRQVDASARQRGDSLQTTLRGRAAKWFNGQIQYSLSRTMSNSNGLDWYPSNDWSPAAEWARADFDRRHRLLVLGTVTAGRQINFGVALTVQSGLPYSELAGVDLFNNGRNNARPLGVPRNSLSGASQTILDVRVSRDFRVHAGGPTLSFGVDAFNVLNTVNYATYIGTVTSPLFEQPVTAASARQLQLSARVRF